jgi:xanthine dehydrogenase small subunit
VSIEANERRLFIPTTLNEALTIKGDHGAVIVQGGTDVGVWINKRGYTAPAMMTLARVAELNRLEVSDAEAIVGANVSLAQFAAAIRDRIPQLYDILTIFGSPQIRNAGTLIGNLANGSPIGDSLPYMFVSGATLDIASSSGTRSVPVEKFYRGYKTFDLTPAEIITAVHVPFVPKDERFELYKVSRRLDLDISAFTAAIRLHVSGNASTRRASRTAVSHQRCCDSQMSSLS